MHERGFSSLLPFPPMSFDHTPEELLEQYHADLQQMEYDPASNGGMDRRQFMFFSLVSAAASTFAAKGIQAQAGAGGATGGRGSGSGAPTQQQQSQVTAPPLGNGEAPAEQFMPWPGGTGPLLAKTYRERGVAAFNRATFIVEPWVRPPRGTRTKSRSFQRIASRRSSRRD